MSLRRTAPGLASLSILLAAALPGCGGKEPPRTTLTPEDYAKVEIGMSVDEFNACFANHNVRKKESIQGNAGRNTGIITYSDGKRSITIQFKNGRVTSRTQVGLTSAPGP